MNLAIYLENKRALEVRMPKYRTMCATCVQPAFSCYCSQVESFDSGIKFVILIHPIEVRRRIATGRMAHLCLVDSELIMGQDYTQHERVNELLDDEQYQALVLYPGKEAIDLRSSKNGSGNAFLPPNNKKLLIFVIDGTWATARKTMRQSQNLLQLQRISFSREKPSTFRVRKQPKAGCFSSIEAIHETIELLAPISENNSPNKKTIRPHDNLLKVFDAMVERQIRCLNESIAKNGGAHYPRFARLKKQNSVDGCVDGYVD